MLQRCIIQLLALTISGVAVLSSCKRGGMAATPSETPQKLFLESCDDARKYPDLITFDDVRWVDCDRPAPRSKAEAFTLGSPVYAPLRGPHVQDSRWYSAGHCEHGGGAITEHNVWYKPEDIHVAIDCSERRCKAKDPLGCRDLGALHWDVEFYPAVKKDEATALAAFEAGCQLGDARSCSAMAAIHEATGRLDASRNARIAACQADLPDTIACEQAGARYLAEGKEDEAKRMLMRGCRGQTFQPTPFGARRDGCGLLAKLAEKAGDEPSRREYLRLDCAYGGSPESCQALGLILLREGDRKRAIPYFRKACGVLPDSKRVFQQSCAALQQ